MNKRAGGPSSISVDSIYQSHGQIAKSPKVFLRGAGIPDDFIGFAKGIAGGVQFYSCFISYSARDHGFATRLHADLQSKGVRCWCKRPDLTVLTEVADSARPK